MPDALPRMPREGAGQVCVRAPSPSLSEDPSFELVIGAPPFLSSCPGGYRGVVRWAMIGPCLRPRARRDKDFLTNFRSFAMSPRPAAGRPHPTPGGAHPRKAEATSDVSS